MNIHVLTPYYRKYLYKTLVHYYEPKHIIWHPICDEVDIEPFKDNKIDWIKPFLCPPLIKGQQCYEKFNHFLNGNEIIDDDIYGFCGDDDMWEEGIFSEIRKLGSEINIIYLSNYRGDKIPNDGGAPHPVHPIIMSSIHQVKPCHIGLGEFFIKGRILKNHRFDNIDGAGDGRFAQKIYKDVDPKTILFRPNWFVFGNYFQPGRHTDKNKFLKNSWKLPEIIE